jgi:hypothetical protein
MWRSFSHSDSAMRANTRSNLNLVDVTPAPIFTRLDGSHDGMLCAVKMLGGMFILG